MKATSNSVIDFSIYMQLTEPEARALEAITLYGSESFLKVFYEKLGKTYLQPHEKGLVSLFDSIAKKIPPHLKRIELTRKTFQDNNPNKD